MTTTENSSHAHTLLQQAHEKGYRFPQGFGGFKATVYFIQESEVSTGNVEVRSPQDVILDIDLAESGQTWLRREIVSIAGHRWYAPYSQGDGRYALTFEEASEHPLGHLLRFHDDPFDSSYRIRDGSLRQINRGMGKVRFSITIQEHTQAGDGHTLPAAFTVAYWSPEEKRLVRTDIYRDTYSKIEGVYLPTSRRVTTADDTGMTTRQLTLSQHSLLAAIEGQSEDQQQVEYRPH